MSDTDTENTKKEVDFDALLDDFLNNELSGIEDYQPSEQALKAGGDSHAVEDEKDKDSPKEKEAKDAEKAPEKAENSKGIAEELCDDFMDQLGNGEKELMKAYNNFLESIYTIAGIQNIEPPEFKLETMMLIPNYRPVVGQTLSEDVLNGWDFLLHVHFEELNGLDMGSSDDEFLNYAEKMTNPNLQFAIVSYVEILIELESCELEYEDKKLRARKRKIEKEFFEEQKRKNERKQRFVDAVKAKNFPIDADRLVTNYLKTANKDPQGAFEALTENPAIYAPIQNEKIKPRFFGLVKKTPRDGIRINKQIGKFLKKLKV